MDHQTFSICHFAWGWDDVDNDERGERGFIQTIKKRKNWPENLFIIIKSYFMIFSFGKIFINIFFVCENIRNENVIYKKEKKKEKHYWNIQTEYNLWIWHVLP